MIAFGYLTFFTLTFAWRFKYGTLFYWPGIFVSYKYAMTNDFRFFFYLYVGFVVHFWLADHIYFFCPIKSCCINLFRLSLPFLLHSFSTCWALLWPYTVPGSTAWAGTSIVVTQVSPARGPSFSFWLNLRLKYSKTDSLLMWPTLCYWLFLS